jgi:hypothetical protein
MHQPATGAWHPPHRGCSNDGGYIYIDGAKSILVARGPIGVPSSKKIPWGKKAIQIVKVCKHLPGAWGERRRFDLGCNRHEAIDDIYMLFQDSGFGTSNAGKTADRKRQPGCQISWNGEHAGELSGRNDALC